MTETCYSYDVVIIGAGPSGSVAAGILLQKGYSVCIVERQEFPRFSIGESLLPQSMVYFAEAGLDHVIKSQNFQDKDGADFHWLGNHTSFDFSEKSTDGPSTTYQVVRADFDLSLIKEIERKGADVHFQATVTQTDITVNNAIIYVTSPERGDYSIKARFCLDASGFGRVLPRLLNLETPSSFPPRKSVFTHVVDGITHPQFNRDRILINVHPHYKDIWYWVIPFSNGSASIGVVGELRYFQNMIDGGHDNRSILQNFIQQDDYLKDVLSDAVFAKPVQTLEGYSCSVKSLHGPGFALLGNAGEFLDPVFSSGITIAVKSASLAANTLDRQFKGETISWEDDFSKPLLTGINTFRAFVESWYEGKLISIFFAKKADDDQIRRYLTSILAGYAWDTGNPYVTHSKRRLNSLYEICQ